MGGTTMPLVYISEANDALLTSLSAELNMRAKSTLLNKLVSMAQASLHPAPDSPPVEPWFTCPEPDVSAPVYAQAIYIDARHMRLLYKLVASGSTSKAQAKLYNLIEGAAYPTI